MKNLYFLFIFFFSLSLHAQQSTYLPGNWSFQNVHEKEKLDSTSIEMIEMLFGNMTLAFSENGLYRASMMGQQDNGTWEFSETEKGLLLKSDSGSNQDFDIIDLTEEQLTLKLSKGILVFKKTGEAPKLEKEAFSEEREKVKITAEEISKKWFLKRKETPGKSKEQIDMLSNMIAGAYFYFYEDGSFEVSIMGMTETGEWKLGDDQSSVITQYEEASKEWNVFSISESQLILYPGNSKEQWIFSTIE